MKRIAFYLMAITALSKVFGFLRDLTLSYFYGASSISDAYLISITIPSIIFIFISTGIATGYIPIQSGILSERGKVEGDRFTSRLINVVLVICLLITFTGLVFTEPIVKAFASGFEGDTLALAVKFTRISIFGIFFTGIVHVFTGYLQLNNNFMMPGFVSLPQNIIIVLSIVLSRYISTTVLAVGVVIAAATQVFFLLPSMRKLDFKYEAKFNFNDENLLQLWKVAVPAMLGVSVNQINSLVDRTIASTLAVGGISSLNYVSKLITFILAIVVASIVSVLYPMISKMVAQKNMEGLKKSIIEALSVINMLTIPAMVGAMIFAEPIVRLLFERGAFDNDAVIMTSGALFFYSIGLLGHGSTDVLIRTFYAMQDTKKPMLLSVASMGLNITLNLILSRFMGINGLALATGISAIVFAMTLFISLRKKIGPFGLKSFMITIAKISASSIFMGVVAFALFSISQDVLGNNIALLISIIFGAVVYFLAVMILNVDGARKVLRVIMRKVKK